MVASDESLDGKKIERRRKAALKKTLATPPKPHALNERGKANLKSTGAQVRGEPASLECVHCGRAFAPWNGNEEVGICDSCIHDD